MACLGFQEPIDGDHAFEGGGEPQPSALMASLSVAVGAVGVGDLESVAQEPPQPPWVQPPGRLDQDRYGLDGHMVGQRTGAGGDHLGMRDRDCPIGQGLGGSGQWASEQGPGGPDMLSGGAVAQVESV
ncbi:MAG TPA: hypothetical protein VL330_00020, partial [Actinomycetes bacterium]|nr:hypothetical protein [Actinomycetes bacterium]